MINFEHLISFSRPNVPYFCCSFLRIWIEKKIKLAFSYTNHPFDATRCSKRLHQVSLLDFHCWHFHCQIFIVMVSLPGFHCQVFIARFSLPNFHCQIFIARFSLPNFHCQIFIARFSLPGFHCQVFYLTYFSRNFFPKIFPKFSPKFLLFIRGLMIFISKLWCWKLI